jgi:hypothetical protein
VIGADRIQIVVSEDNVKEQYLYADVLAFKPIGKQNSRGPIGIELKPNISDETILPPPSMRQYFRDKYGCEAIVESPRLDCPREEVLQKIYERHNARQPDTAVGETPQS